SLRTQSRRIGSAARHGRFPHRLSAATTLRSVNGDAMPKAEPSRAIRITAEVLNEATEILRPHAPPEALPILPELLCVWEQEGLPEHLSLREAHSAFRARTEQLADLRQKLAY